MQLPPPANRLSRIGGTVKSGASATLALAGLALFLAWMGGAFHEKVAPGVVPVERPSAAGRKVVTVERTMGEETISAVGTVQPRKKSDIASQLLVAIREIKVRAGDTVKAGDTLVTLDDRELLAQDREATAALATAEADAVTRKSDFERIKSLRSGGSVSTEEIGRVEGAFRIAETQVRRAKETIGRIEVLLTYTRIQAPADGLVADRYADPGELATPGKPILTIYDPKDLELQANVPESLAAGIGLGRKLTLRIDANHLTVEASVREIVPLAQQASRSVVVKLALPTVSNNPILPGTFGRVTIPVGRTERIWIPVAAVQRVGQLDLVEVVDGNGKLERRFVRVGRETENRIEIQSGLTVGEKVALPNR